MSIVTVLIFFGCIALMCATAALLSGGSTQAFDSSPICYTPVAVGTLAPGAPTPEPICVTRTPAPRSSGGGFFVPSSGGSMRSGSSGSRSTSGGGGHSGGGGGGK